MDYMQPTARQSSPRKGIVDKLTGKMFLAIAIIVSVSTLFSIIDTVSSNPFLKFNDYVESVISNDLIGSALGGEVTGTISDLLGDFSEIILLIILIGQIPNILFAVSFWLFRSGAKNRGQQKKIYSGIMIDQIVITLFTLKYVLLPVVLILAGLFLLFNSAPLVGLILFAIAALILFVVLSFLLKIQNMLNGLFYTYNLDDNYLFVYGYVIFALWAMGILKVFGLGGGFFGAMAALCDAVALIMTALLFSSFKKEFGQPDLKKLQGIMKNPAGYAALLRPKILNGEPVIWTPKAFPDINPSNIRPAAASYTVQPAAQPGQNARPAPQQPNNSQANAYNPVQTCLTNTAQTNANNTARENNSAAFSAAQPDSRPIYVNDPAPAATESNSEQPTQPDNVQSPVQPVQQFSQPQQVQPQYAQPVQQFSQPQQAPQQYAQPVQQFSQPQQVQPQYAQPVQQFSQPQQAPQQYAQPVQQFSQPRQVQPQYAQPVQQFSQPQQVQPQYAQPVQQFSQPQQAPQQYAQPVQPVQTNSYAEMIAKSRAKIAAATVGIFGGLNLLSSINEFSVGLFFEGKENSTELIPQAILSFIPSVLMLVLVPLLYSVLRTPTQYTKPNGKQLEHSNRVTSLILLIIGIVILAFVFGLLTSLINKSMA